jgi:hypothetical protein
MLTFKEIEQSIKGNKVRSVEEEMERDMILLNLNLYTMNEIAEFIDTGLITYDEYKAYRQIRED